jgi:hypothetical protein
MMREMGNHFSTQLRKASETKKRIRIVGDNVNFAVGQADLRMDSNRKVKDLHHAFASAALIHNFDFKTLSNSEPENEGYNLDVQDFIPNAEDYNRLKSSFIYHLTQLTIKFLPFFKVLKDLVRHPDSPNRDQLKEKTQVVLLDTLYKNEQKYAEVVDIPVLDSYEQVISDTFEDLRDIKINIGGDQLTRERFSRAKSLRAGANDPKEQLKHLHPITFEMFHLHMKFLMVFFKFLYSEKSGDEVGTMKSAIDRIIMPEASMVRRYTMNFKSVVCSVVFAGNCYHKLLYIGKKNFH